MTRARRFTLLGFASGFAMLAALPASAQEFITVASTTSTENSGLFGAGHWLHAEKPILFFETVTRWLESKG